MSVQHANIGIVKKDLQLYYNREYNGSFLGEATVNFFSIPTYVLQNNGNHAGSFKTSTSAGVPDLVVSGNKQVYYAPEYYTLVATGAWLAETNRLIIYPKLGSGATTSYVPNGTYNFSFYARSLSGNTVLQYSFYGITPRSTATLTTKWQRFNGTFTINNGPQTLLEFGNLNAGSMVCQIACIQVEAKSYATPFTVPVLWTPNLVNVTSTSGHTTMTKNTGDGWTNSRVYSSEGYNEPCYVSFKANAINKSFMVALNSDPATGINYTNLDYAWYADSNTIPQVYENGSQIAVYSTYTTSTLFEIIYDGVNVKYYMDGVLKYTSLVSPTLPLYLDSSFYTLNAQIVNLSFGKLSQINRFSNYVIGGGGLKDISGNNVNADLTNVLFNSSGYYFDGSSTSINTGYSILNIDPSQSFSIEAIVNFDALTSYSPSTFTISNVNTTTNVITTSVNHNLVVGDRISFYVSGGSLPSPLIDGSNITPYYIISPTTNTFKVSTSSGGSEVDITTAGSGTITALIPNKAGMLFGRANYGGIGIYYNVSPTNVVSIWGYSRTTAGYYNTPIVAISTGITYLITVVFDELNGRIYSLYINGVSQGSASCPSSAIYNNSTVGNFSIGEGGQADGGGTLIYNPFKGSCPMQRIYRRALTAAEVLQNFNATRTTYGI